MLYGIGYIIDSRGYRSVEADSEDEAIEKFKEAITWEMDINPNDIMIVSVDEEGE